MNNLFLTSFFQSSHSRSHSQPSPYCRHPLETRNSVYSVHHGPMAPLIQPAATPLRLTGNSDAIVVKGHIYEVLKVSTFYSMRLIDIRNAHF